MVFVKFHNMNRKKKISNVAFKLKQPQNFSLYNKSKQCYYQSSKMFSILFFFFQSMYCLFKKKSSFFLSFSFFICCVQQCSSFFFFSFFSSFSPFSLSCSFLFLFCFSFLFSFFSIINCSFNVPCFSNLISTSLCPYLNTITIGSLPSLFNFDLKYLKLSLIYNKTFSIAYEHSSFFFFFSLHKISRVFF